MAKKPQKIVSSKVVPTFAKALFTKALEVRKKAYAPYSKFQVGAALKDDRGNIHIGCNFENSSYGAAICAERNAIGAMIAQGGKHITEITIVASVEQGCPPCGICRQVLAEFAKNPYECQVHIANLKGVVRSFSLADLLPEAFTAKYL